VGGKIKKEKGKKNEGEGVAVCERAGEYGKVMPCHPMIQKVLLLYMFWRAEGNARINRYRKRAGDYTRG